MKHLLLATTLMGALAAALPAAAQSTAPTMTMSAATQAAADAPVGKAANTFMIRGRLIGVIPLNSNSSIDVIGGTVSTSNAVAPELDFSYFITDNIALELIAATTKHSIYANNSALGSKFKVGTTWVLPPTLLLQYHFMPKERFSPYLGVGLNVTWFYATQPANGLTSLAMKPNVGVALQAGFDYNFSGHWFANFDIKQIFLNANASVNGAIQAHTALNPLVIGAGIGYRF
ncbi:MAG: OmpW family protein [Acetobacteraceae bacterium]